MKSDKTKKYLLGILSGIIINSNAFSKPPEKTNQNQKTTKIVSLKSKENIKSIDTSIYSKTKKILEKEKNTDLVVFPEFTFIDKTKHPLYLNKTKAGYEVNEKSSDFIEKTIPKYQNLAEKTKTNLLLGGFYTNYKDSLNTTMMIQINKKGNIESKVKKWEPERDEFKVNNKTYLPLICYEVRDKKFQKHLEKENKNYSFIVYTENSLGLNKRMKKRLFELYGYYESEVIKQNSPIVYSNGKNGKAGIISNKKGLINYKETENYVTGEIKNRK